MLDHRELIAQMLILCGIAALFALLHIIAAASQLGKQDKKGKKVKKRYVSHWMMIIGGLLMIQAVVLCIFGSALDWASALLGGLFVCFAALMNGRRSGNMHKIHHIIRAVIAAAIVVGFVLL